MLQHSVFKTTDHLPKVQDMTVVNDIDDTILTVPEDPAVILDASLAPRVPQIGLVIEGMRGLNVQ